MIEKLPEMNEVGKTMESPCPNPVALELPHISFGEVGYLPGGSCGPRIQQDVQIVLIHEGHCTVTLDGEPREVPAQHMSLHRPGHHEFFQFSLKKNTRHSWLSIHVDALDPAIVSQLEGLPFELPISTRMEELVRLGLSIHSAPHNPIGRHQLQRLAECGVLEFIDRARAGKDAQPMPESIMNVRNYIDRHYGEDLDLETLGRVAHVTPPHLIRLFRRHLGETPIHYLWDVRLARSQQLLRDTGLNISEIAWQTGFKTPAHFSRAFKKKFRQSPREFRSEVWRTHLS